MYRETQDDAWFNFPSELIVKPQLENAQQLINHMIKQWQPRL
jgi:hypothetical protein